MNTKFHAFKAINTVCCNEGSRHFVSHSNEYKIHRCTSYCRERERGSEKIIIYWASVNSLSRLSLSNHISQFEHIITMTEWEFTSIFMSNNTRCGRPSTHLAPSVLALYQMKHASFEIMSISHQIIRAYTIHTNGKERLCSDR